jgi:hypothetical protein
MRRFKRIIYVLFAIISITYLFRGWIYRYTVTYQTIGQRGTYTVIDKNLLGQIEAGSSKQTLIDEATLSVEEIITLSLSTTARHLHFTAESSNQIDPNKLCYTRSAHCIGYAAYFSVSCNHLLKKHGLSEDWLAQPQIGQLYFFGTNIHPHLHSSFLKDHDFVTIKNKRSGEVLAVDPSVSDCFGIEYVTMRSF